MTNEAGSRGDSGTPPLSAPILQSEEGGATASAQTKVAALSFTEIIRQLRMMAFEVEHYKSVVSLGSLRDLRIRCLDKASEIVERAQTEHKSRGRR